MEDLLFLVLQFFLEIFGDFLVQLLFEGLCELLSHTPDLLRRVIALRKWEAPFGAFLTGYGLAGALSGFISVALVPHIFIHRLTTRIIAIIVIPLILGFVFSGIGRVREKFGQTRTKIDYFLCAYAFALSMALVRFWLIK